MSDNRLDPLGQPRIGVAIYGCGIIATNHADAIGRLPELEIVALVDVLEPAATALADHIEERGGPRPPTYPSLDEALAAGGVDLVVVCLPSGLHVAAAEAALGAGCHVVIEKPLDVSLPRARRIAELARDAAERGLVVTVISQHRFDPASVVVQRAAAFGGFGRLTSGVASIAWWRSQEYYDQAGWRGTWALDGGGAAMNQGVHTIDLLVWMLGRPVEVSARMATLAHERIEVEDTLVATVTFESGALGVVHATTAAYPEVGTRLQIHGSRGSGVIEQDQLRYFHSADREGEGDQAASLVDPEDLSGNERPADSFVIGHARQYRDIVDTIRSGGSPGVTVDDALVTLAVIRGFYLSAARGSSVAISDVLSGSFDAEEPKGRTP